MGHRKSPGKKKIGSPGGKDTSVLFPNARWTKHYNKFTSWPSRRKTSTIDRCNLSKFGRNIPEWVNYLIYYNNLLSTIEYDRNWMRTYTHQLYVCQCKIMIDLIVSDGVHSLNLKSTNSNRLATSFVWARITIQQTQAHTTRIHDRNDLFDCPNARVVITVPVGRLVSFLLLLLLCGVARPQDQQQFQPD